jgi:hypothetical protein
MTGRPARVSSAQGELHMKHWIAAAFIAAAALGQPAAAAGETTATAYDLLFRPGTLDALPAGEDLVYDRMLALPADPEQAAAWTGRIALELDETTPRMARLVFHREGQHRGLGAFPAGMGNPMIMYFVETVARDMSNITGGSPFYIRNRLKDALASPAQVGSDPEGAVTVTLRPFEGDPNHDRMQGFGDLVLTVTMNETAPGWLSGMVAEAPGDDAPVYRFELALLPDAEAAP